jgi:hypothetical protein
VAAAQPAGEPLEVIAGPLQLAGTGGGGRTGAGAGPHKHPPHPEHGIGGALAGDGHGVLHHPVAAPLVGWLALVAFGAVVHRGGRCHLQAGEHLGTHVGLGRRRDKVDLGGQQVAQVGVGDQLGVPNDEEAARPGQLAQRPHRPGDLGDLPGAAVIGVMPHRHAAVAADRKADLDLLQVGAAVLGMAEPGGDEPSSGSS